MRDEIDEWYGNGFTVDSLESLLIEDPVDLALRMASIRESVANHEQLRRRVSGLDWTRDPELSVAVNLDLTRPERLAALSAEIPQIMMDLAQKNVVDSDFKFIAWRPRKRTKPVLIPAPANNVEDAMEAILKEMESNEAESTEELPTSDDNESEPEGQVREEDSPKKKPGRIKGLVSGGGRDGVGKFGALGDMVGGITDRLGVTNYGLAGASAKKKDEGQEVQPEEQVETDEDTSPTTHDVAGDDSPLESILRSLGLEDEADMLLDNGDVNLVRRSLASHVGLEPRDTRLDRLLRLSLRLMPKGDDEDEQRYAMLSTLASLANELSKWTRIRLEARHSGAVGNLLEDSLTLGGALIRIPGPGVALPLDADDHNLPAADEIDSLSHEVNVLKRRIMLASAGGVR